MAKIKGIQLKSVQYFRSPDGGGVNANVYMDNKLIGDIHDGGYGGGLQVHIYGAKREEFEKRVDEYYKEHPADFDGEEFFFEEILDLMETEKFFKKQSKTAPTFVVQLKFVPRKNEKPDYDTYAPDKKFACLSMVNVERLVAKEKPVEYKVFSKAEDFIIN